MVNINPLNAELNPICHLLSLLGAHHIFHTSGLRVKIAFFNVFNTTAKSTVGFVMSVCLRPHGTTRFPL